MDHEKPSRMDSGVEPFRWWTVDGDSIGHDVPPPSWPGWEVHYDNDLERGKRTTRMLRPLPKPFYDAMGRFFSPDRAAQWANLTGIEGLVNDPTLHGAGVHVIDPGGFLQVHADYEVKADAPGMERRLNVILFLSREWRPEWGGQLLLCDPSGNVVREFDPAPGRVVLFECGVASYHGVRVTSPDAPPRITAANYFLAPTRPTATRTRAVFLPNRSPAGMPPREVS